MATMKKTINATVTITENEHCLVWFTISTEAGDQIASGHGLSIGNACQAIGAAIYEAE